MSRRTPRRKSKRVHTVEFSALDLENESVTVINTGSEPVSMDDYTIHDHGVEKGETARNVFIFKKKAPGLMLQPGKEVTIYCGPGSRNAREYDNETAVHWFNYHVWDNDEDTAYLCYGEKTDGGTSFSEAAFNGELAGQKKNTEMSTGSSASSSNSRRSSSKGGAEGDFSAGEGQTIMQTRKRKVEVPVTRKVRVKIAKDVIVPEKKKVEVDTPGFEQVTGIETVVEEYIEMEPEKKKRKKMIWVQKEIEEEFEDMVPVTKTRRVKRKKPRSFKRVQTEHVVEVEGSKLVKEEVWRIDECDMVKEAEQQVEEEFELIPHATGRIHVTGEERELGVVKANVTRHMGDIIYDPDDPALAGIPEDTSGGAAYTPAAVVASPVLGVPSAPAVPSTLVLQFFERLRKNEDRNYIIVVDRSGSMAGSSWTEAQDALSAIAPLCESSEVLSVNPFTVYFFSSGRPTRFKGIKNTADVKKMFARTAPSGMTDMCAVMKCCFIEHAKGSKPTSVLVITDGAPNKPGKFAEMIQSQGNKLMKADELSVSFIQVGTDAAANEYLNFLDAQLATKVDFVDMVSVNRLRDADFDFTQLIAQYTS